MSKNIWGWLLVAGALTAAGCATGRDYQADIDALNSKVTALQGLISQKDEEIEKLKNKTKEESAARMQAENERRRLSEKLDSALAELEERNRPAPKPQIPDSDLK